MITDSVQLLNDAAYTLSKCGRKVYHPGQTAVLIPRSFLMQANFAAGVTQGTQTIVKEISGEAPWMLRAISATTSIPNGNVALALQLRLPNGKFLLSNLQDILQFAGFGSYRYLFTKELECPPG